MVRENFKEIDFKALYRQNHSAQVISGNEKFINFMYSMFPMNEDLDYRKSVVGSINNDNSYFPINMDDIYSLFFSDKGGMVRHILKDSTIVEGIDFILIKGNMVSEPRADIYMLSIPFIYWMLFSGYWIYGYDIVGFDIVLDWDLINLMYSDNKMVFDDMVKNIGLSKGSDYVIVPDFAHTNDGKTKKDKIMISLKTMSSIRKYAGVRSYRVKFKTYIIRDYVADIYKIGKSVNIYERFRQIYCCNPHVSLYAYLDNNIEAKLHKEYDHKRIPNSCEWFRLSQEDLDKIISEHGFTLSPSRNSINVNCLPAL